MPVTAEYSVGEVGVPNLTDRQRRFVQAYIDEPNATEAYRVACGHDIDDATARNCGPRMLKEVAVKAALAAYRIASFKRTGVNGDWVIMKLVDTVERCMQEQAVLGVDGEPTGEYRFNATGAVAALRELGKHFGIFEKDNKQKNVPLTEDEIESVKAKLRERGIDLDRARQRSPN